MPRTEGRRPASDGADVRADRRESGFGFLACFGATRNGSRPIQQRLPWYKPTVFEVQKTRTRHVRSRATCTHRRAYTRVLQSLVSYSVRMKAVLTGYMRIRLGGSRPDCGAVCIDATSARCRPRRTSRWQVRGWLAPHAQPHAQPHAARREDGHWSPHAPAAAATCSR
jgi:hypothetical protein